VFKLCCDHNLLCAFFVRVPSTHFQFEFLPAVATNLAHVFFPFLLFTFIFYALLCLIFISFCSCFLLCFVIYLIYLFMSLTKTTLIRPKRHGQLIWLKTLSPHLKPRLPNGWHNRQLLSRLVIRRQHARRCDVANDGSRLMTSRESVISSTDFIYDPVLWHISPLAKNMQNSDKEWNKSCPRNTFNSYL